MKLFQAYINEHQKSYIIDDVVIPLDASDNVGDNKFEYDLFKKIESKYPELKQEPWGMVSWKFQHKTLISTQKFYEFAEKKFSEGYDCVFINPMIGNESLFLNVWEQGNMFHTGMDKILDFIKENITEPKMNDFMGKNLFTFCNYFIATPSFWEKYFQFVDNIISKLEIEASNNSEIGKIYSKSHEYRYSYDVSLKPFIVERLLSSFMVCSEFNCIGYEYSQSDYDKKFGIQLGSFIFNLSKLKSEDNLACYFDVRNNVFNSILLTLIINLDDPNQYFISPEFKKMLV